jgi:tRNA(Ile2)-agmatinylcytidine synthase
LEDSSDEIECAAYEPTKSFRDVIRQLAPGDILRVFGGVGRKGTLNIEKIEILELKDVYETLNPLCDCGKRMKSAGKDKGYKCPNCGTKTSAQGKEKKFKDRNIHKGYYEAPASARRHLSKPLIRFQKKIC